MSQKLYSIGQIAEALKVPIHRVEYVIRARGVTHIGWVGNARVYDEQALQWIKLELDRIDLDRNPQESGT